MFKGLSVPFKKSGKGQKPDKAKEHDDYEDTVKSIKDENDTETGDINDERKLRLLNFVKNDINIALEETTMISRCMEDLQNGELFRKDQLKQIMRNMKVLEVPNSWNIIQKDDEGVGIFIILDGRVSIIDNVDDEELEIGMKTVGDYVGEVSTLYDVNATATVRTLKKCKLVFVQKIQLVRVIKEARMSLTDWCGYKKYIPTKTDGLDDGRICRRLVFQALSCLPMFHLYNDEEIKSLIISMIPTLLTLYPPNSYITYQKDPVQNVYIVISGSLNVKKEREEIKMEIKQHPVIIGEEDYLKERVHGYTVFTTSFCPVITIKKEILDEFLQRKPISGDDDKLNVVKEVTDMPNIIINSFQRNNSLTEHIEVLQYMISSSSVFNQTSLLLLYYIAINAHVIYLQPQEAFNIDKSGYDGLLMILKGEVEIIHIDTIARTYSSDEHIWTNEVVALRNKSDVFVTAILITKECLSDSLKYQSEEDKNLSSIKDVMSEVT